MARVIYKYDLFATSKEEIQMPAGAEMLSIQMQFDKLKLWAIVDTNEAHRETKNILIYATGEEVTEDNIRFIQTIQMDRGNLIFHIFEKLPEKSCKPVFESDVICGILGQYKNGHLNIIDASDKIHNFYKRNR